MSKRIEWLKEEIGELPCVDTVFKSDGSSYIDSAVPVMAVYDLIDQLDEPNIRIGTVPAKYLQNLLVPKQEENNNELYRKFVEIVQMSPASAHDLLNTLENLVAKHGTEKQEEQNRYVVKSTGLDGVHYYFTKFDDEMNGLFGLPNDKEGVYRFDNKEKAQAIANYTNSEVEELEE